MGIVLTKLMTQLSSYSMSSVNYYLQQMIPIIFFVDVENKTDDK